MTNKKKTYMYACMQREREQEREYLIHKVKCYADDFNRRVRVR